MKLLEMYSKLITEYQVNLQINNVFYEKIILKEGLENNGKKSFKN